MVIFPDRSLFAISDSTLEKLGSEMIDFASQIISFPRSLTGEGNRQTLKSIQTLLPNLKVRSVPSGKRIYDWEIPLEWAVDSAYIIDPTGKRICDFDENPLYLIGYSEAFDGKLSLDELQNHLFSLPEQPEAVPYVTSYYKKRWGFCISQIERDNLPPGEYQVHINTRKFQGVLNYGELVIKGRPGSPEILFSTYICHPKMANNEISGPTLLTFLARQLAKQKESNLTFRFIFIPETIGSLAYIKRNLRKLRRRTLSAFNVTCVGDEREYSYLPSRNGNQFSDRAALHTLNMQIGKFKEYSWLDRGSDERQFDSPKVRVPMTSIMRSKYGEYNEYHTSLDSLGEVVTARGLRESLRLYLNLTYALQVGRWLPKVKTFGEPQLSKRGLYPDLSIKGNYGKVKNMMDLLSLSDGGADLLEIANKLAVPIWELSEAVSELVENDLISLRLATY